MKRDKFLDLHAAQQSLDLCTEIGVDLFAGGGGASTGFEMAFGHPPHVAINHNDNALSMHRVNHPFTRHMVADVREVDPRRATDGRPVGHLHLSPDCTHHSQAAGGQPRDKKLRALSWVGIHWAGTVLPRCISLENVKQILQWGPLVAKRDPETGRVITLDLIKCPDTGRMINRVASPGERVPVQNQYLIPNKKKAGRNWKRFVSMLRELGYTVDWRVLNAADYGAPTTRERLFLYARRDGAPIHWPEATHCSKPTKGQKQWRGAHECIDWSLESKSIFGRKKSLADATLRRIAKGIVRYVLNSADPFIVPIAHYNGSEPVHNIKEPLRTITANPKGGAFAVATPVMIQAGHGEVKAGKKRWSHGCKDARSPLGTVTASAGGHAVAVAHMMQANGGFSSTPAHDMRRPLTTVTNTGSQQQLVTANLVTMRNNAHGGPMDEPISTICAGTTHHGLVTAFLSSYYSDESNRCRDARDPAATITTENRLGLVECTLSKEHEAGALRVAAFLMRYYSEGGQWGDLRDPMDTITTKDRLALVTVHIQGTPYVIVDIQLRMLAPRELYRAQSFPDSYIIERGHDGRAFTKSEQVKMVGNSVPPEMIAALLRANKTAIQGRKAA